MSHPDGLIDRDGEHLRLLSIFHYVLAGLQAFTACIFVIHVIIGLVMLAGGMQGRGGGPPVVFGIFFLTMGLVAMGIGVTAALLLYIAGRFLGERSHYTYCFVIAVLSCLAFPLGTVLGVFTVVVLSRPSVRALFEVQGGTSG